MNNVAPQWDKTTPFCLGQVWYLANDMQFYWISPLFLYTLWRWEYVGLALSMLGLVGGTVIPMVLVGVNEFPLGPSFLDFSEGFEKGMNYFYDVYITPWCRFQPYIMGIMFGYLLHKLRNNKKLVKMNPYTAVWIWAVMAVIGGEVVYGLFPYFEEFATLQTTGGGSVGTLAESVAYNGLHRVAWCVSLGWVILACEQGWKFMSCSHCQEFCQQADWLLIGCTRVINESDARSAS